VCELPDKTEEPAVKCSHCSKWVHVNGKCDGGKVTEETWKLLKSGEETFECSICVEVKEEEEAEKKEKKKGLGLIVDTYLGRGKDDSNFQCDLDGCVKSFPSQNELEKHQKSVHERSERRRSRSTRSKRGTYTDGDEFDEEESDGSMSDESFEEMLAQMQDAPPSRRKRGRQENDDYVDEE
jgi:hypothetical protein